MKKIIHLSDLHIGHEDCEEKFRTIAERIIYLSKPAEDFVIVITGDIVENANHPGYIEASLTILDLLTSSGLKVLVVPGNHDYGTGAMGDAKFVEPFKEKYYRTTAIEYPKVDIFEDAAFIGLDSTAEELHWHDRYLSEGELGRKQLGRLEQIIDNPDIASLKKIVYLHHHPFDYKPGMQLKDSRNLKKIIENRIDLLLFGHYHNDSHSVNKSLHGTWGIPRCYNAGSSTHKNGDTGYHRVISLSGNDPSSDFDANYI